MVILHVVAPKHQLLENKPIYLPNKVGKTLPPSSTFQRVLKVAFKIIGYFENYHLHVMDS
jgi:hypothetical protein